MLLSASPQTVERGDQDEARNGPLTGDPAGVFACRAPRLRLYT